jgi:hypothetical protein
MLLKYDFQTYKHLVKFLRSHGLKNKPPIFCNVIILTQVHDGSKLYKKKNHNTQRTVWFYILYIIIYHATSFLCFYIIYYS